MGLRMGAGWRGGLEGLTHCPEPGSTHTRTQTSRSHFTGHRFSKMHMKLNFCFTCSGTFSLKEASSYFALSSEEWDTGKRA